MNKFENWVKSVQELLFRLQDLDLGYPLGDNRVLPPQHEDTADKALFLAQASNFEHFKLFYSVCDGVSLPDVHIGYFIKSVTDLKVLDLSSEPIQIIRGDFNGEVLPFGSTGGGGLFVMRRAIRDVLHLAPGLLENGIYDGGSGKVTRLAESFYGFLECLFDDVRGFVNSESDHRFIC